MPEGLKSEDIGFSFTPDPTYIKTLVQQQMIPVQRKYMAAALKSLCLSCEHCEYCPKKTAEVKCIRFQNYLAHYQNLIINEIL